MINLVISIFYKMETFRTSFVLESQPTVKKHMDVPPCMFVLPHTILHFVDISPVDKYPRNAG
jgi:hypothetical protein